MPHRAPRGRRPAGTIAAAVLLVTAALASCSLFGDAVEVKTEADASALVQQRGEQIASLAGGPLTDPAISPASCEGKFGESSDTVFSTLGVWVVPMEASKHLDTIARVRDAWKAQGYDITDDRKIGENRGVLTAKTDDGYTLDLTSQVESKGFRVMVSSPCFESPTSRR